MPDAELHRVVSSSSRACHRLVKISSSWKLKMGSKKMEPFYLLNMGNILIFHLKHSKLHFFALTLYKENLKKIQGKILKVSILTFWAVKLNQKLFSGIGLHSWGPDASFDTHIALSLYGMCRMAYVSNMAFLAFLT